MDIVVLRLALSVEGKGAQPFGKVRVIREHRPAVAIAAEGLGRIEAGAGNMAERAAHGSAAGRSAYGLGGILDDEEPLAFCNCHDRAVVGRLSEKIDRDDGLRNEPSLLPYHVDCRFEAG